MTVTAQMMNKGEFKLVQARTGADDVRIEYWLGVNGNGACLRLLHRNDLVTTSHVHDSHRIEDWLARYEYEMARDEG
jgi:hypothetical protein